MIYSYSNIGWWYTATISYIIIQSPYWYTTIGYKGFYFPIDFGIVHHVKSVFNQPQWGMTEDLEHCSFGDVSKPAFCFLFFSFFSSVIIAILNELYFMMFVPKSVCSFIRTLMHVRRVILTSIFTVIRCFVVTAMSQWPFEMVQQFPDDPAEGLQWTAESCGDWSPQTNSSSK